MKWICLLLTISIVFDCTAQQLGASHLQVKKGVKIRKKIYTGTQLIIEDKQHRLLVGPLDIINDSLLTVGQNRIAVSNIERIKLLRRKRAKMSAETIAMISLGFVVTTVGMTASGHETFGRATLNSAAIAGFPLTLGYLRTRDLSKKTFKRKKFSFKVWKL